MLFRKTAPIRIQSFPMEYDQWFWAKQERENAKAASEGQNEQSQGIRNPEIQKSRKPENQESSDMS